MLPAWDGACCPSPAWPVACCGEAQAGLLSRDCWSQRLVGKGTQPLSLGIFGPVHSRTCSQAVPQTTCCAVLVVKGAV